MRIIEKKMVHAFNCCYDFRLSNTAVYVSGPWVLVFLHDNLIAKKNTQTGVISWGCGGWHSRTTSSRLRALGCPCHIKTGRIVYDDGTGEVDLKIDW